MLGHSHTKRDPITHDARTFVKRVDVDAPTIASSESEGEDDVSASSDDGWLPICTGPAPQGVALRNLFGDEDALILEAVSLMTHVPMMLTCDIYNNNERLIARNFLPVAKKPAGKRETKEKKEFRLKILVRTVAVMQHLLVRVTVLEADRAWRELRALRGQPRAQSRNAQP
ncbi:hypothetical protein B0H10DRAFT_2218547 [Mycena sp. CBHHK59/15]|nr:hypothetical protein B0H10DRAFT_2218547 [Mycena sp. CBHHK59/15]